MSCLEHRKRLAWNTGDVLFGTQEMLGTHEMSCLEHTRCLAWKTGEVLLETQEMMV